MSTKQEEKKKSVPSAPWVHWFAVLGCVLTSLIILAEAGYLWIDQRYDQSIAPGVHIGAVRVGGQSHLETLTQFETYTNRVAEAGLTFVAGDVDIEVSPASLATDDPDLALSLYTFEPEASVDSAYSIGRSGKFWPDVRDRIRALFGSVDIPLLYEFNDEQVITLLQEAVAEKEVPAVNAAISAEEDALTIRPESTGEKFDLAGGIRDAKSAIEALVDPIRISLKKVPDEPTVTEADLRPLLSEAEKVLDRGEVTLTLPERTTKVEPSTLATWFVGRVANGRPGLGFGGDALDAYFSDLAESVDRAPVEGRFEFQNGSLLELKAGSPGRTIDRPATTAALETALLAEAKTEAMIVVRDSEPNFSGEKIGQLAHLELLGTGHSNFSGSPNNRRHNIATGSAALHGLVIQPDKEFSLVEALGPIEKETGYLPELVIKGNKTVPEYGGGLCQVGTTTFRAAMAAALPVTERRNHSYSVSYYLENGLPGTDATIYPAHPDMRFMNDTGHPILIQVRIEGNDLSFDFWGTKDGRTSERTTPRVWDRVSPPPTKEVETTDLAPGVRKCTERAHTGLKASFTYTIHYANGETKEQTFTSTYKPWQEVCLVGKAA
jgi:vancomycin resistance protein YoaR